MSSELKQFDRIENRTGKQIIIECIDMSRMTMEPGEFSVARVEEGFIFSDGLITFSENSRIALKIRQRAESRVVNLPYPKQGVIYVVAPEVALHEKVRRRSDVFTPEPPEGQTYISARIFRGLVRG